MTHLALYISHYFDQKEDFPQMLHSLEGLQSLKMIVFFIHSDANAGAEDAFHPDSPVTCISNLRRIEPRLFLYRTPYPEESWKEAVVNDRDLWLEAVEYSKSVGLCGVVKRKVRVIPVDGYIQINYQCVK